MKQGSLTFKPVLVARGVVKFQLAYSVPARNKTDAPQRKTLDMRPYFDPFRLYAPERVQALGYDAQGMIERFEAYRLGSKVGFHVCKFCGSMWGVALEHAMIGAHTSEDVPRIWCCGWCFAHVMQGIRSEENEK